MSEIQKSSLEQKSIKGKIIHIANDGWGFISSPDIEFTRIFFHWTALIQKTKNFKELELGMKVSFKAINVPEKGWRAIKIEVIDDDSDKTNGAANEDAIGSGDSGE